MEFNSGFKGLIGRESHQVFCVRRGVLPLRRDRPGYCTAEVGNAGGTYELPCTYEHVSNSERLPRFSCLNLQTQKPC